ncbi:MAG: hypothetical protein AAGK25_06385 [Pseudomonadota bacterium]
MVRVSLFIAILWYALLAAPAHANVRVFEVGLPGGGTTTATPFSQAQSAQAFFNNNDLPSSPVFQRTPGAFQLYFHHDTTTDLYSIGGVTNLRRGQAGQLSLTLSGLSPSAFIAVADEANEVSQTGPGTFEVNFRWVNCCADNFVISGIDPNTTNITLTVNSSTNLNTFGVAGADGLVTTPLTGPFSSVISSAPEPATWALMILGFMATASRLKALRRRGVKLALPVLEPVHTTLNTA